MFNIRTKKEEILKKSKVAIIENLWRNSVKIKEKESIINNRQR